MRKHQSQAEEHSTKYLTNFLEKCQGHERQQRVGELSRTGGHQGDMTRQHREVF